MVKLRSKSNEENLKKLEREVTDLGVAFKSSDQTLKGVCTKKEKMEQLIMDMNNKYESIVSMLAQMSASKGNQRDKQVEGTWTPPQSSSGVRDSGPGNNSGQIYGKYESKLSTKLHNIDFPYFD
ncbi:Uncharacterized protein Adt_12136 [Abeliophyllum distichum]|uniref:Uncharacterized protein n=1 Tax=Abeliophyllum distichum TaxID=126358 RepID=A0ABD1UPW4_9LAMI